MIHTYTCINISVFCCSWLTFCLNNFGRNSVKDWWYNRLVQLSIDCTKSWVSKEKHCKKVMGRLVWKLWQLVSHSSRFPLSNFCAIRYLLMKHSFVTNKMLAIYITYTYICYRRSYLQDFVPTYWGLSKSFSVATSSCCIKWCMWEFNEWL